jgi:cation:H+ antiporter
MAFVLAIFLLTAGALLLGGTAFRISSRFGLGPLLSGIIVVGFATSFPEVVSTLVASEKGAGAAAFATLVGSNSFNSLFILGLVVLVSRPTLPFHEVRFDAWIALAASGVPVAAILIQHSIVLRRVLALGSLGLLLAYTVHAIVVAFPSRSRSPGTQADSANPRPRPSGLAADLAGAVLGLVLLSLGSGHLVERVLAQPFGAADAAGSTLLAAATSLPELVVALYAAWRGWSAIAVGSVLGSNIFNMLGALGGTLLFSRLPGDGGHPLADTAFMTAACAVALWVLHTQKPHRRLIAVLMVAAWMAYATIRVYATTG